MLDALPEPVIPQALHPKCAQVTTRDEAFEVQDSTCCRHPPPLFTLLTLQVLDGLPGALVNVCRHTPLMECTTLSPS